MGVLYASRSFEHKLDSGEVIRGKADPTLDLSSLVEWDRRGRGERGRGYNGGLPAPRGTEKCDESHDVYEVNRHWM